MQVKESLQKARGAVARHPAGGEPLPRHGSVNGAGRSRFDNAACGRQNLRAYLRPLSIVRLFVVIKK